MQGGAVERDTDFDEQSAKRAEENGGASLTAPLLAEPIVERLDRLGEMLAGQGAIALANGGLPCSAAQVFGPGLRKKCLCPVSALSTFCFSCSCRLCRGGRRRGRLRAGKSSGHLEDDLDGGILDFQARWNLGMHRPVFLWLGDRRAGRLGGRTPRQPLGRRVRFSETYFSEKTFEGTLGSYRCLLLNEGRALRLEPFKGPDLDLIRADGI